MEEGQGEYKEPNDKYMLSKTSSLSQKLNTCQNMQR